MTTDQLFNQITDEFKTGLIVGWCPLEKAIDLATKIVELRPSVIVETGVFGGKSLLPMAMACEAINCGTVIGIDPWSAPASAEGYAGVNADWWKQVDHEKIYQGFLANVERLGLSHRIQIQRCKSDDAVIPESIGMLHLDSQHSDLATREVNRFASRITQGGIVCLDDIAWNNDGDLPVMRAIDALLPLGFTELFRRAQSDGNWGIFKRHALISLPASAQAKDESQKHNETGRALAARIAARRKGQR